MPYKLIGEVIKVKGKCVAGFKAGDKIDLTIPYTEKEVKKMDEKKQKFCGSLFHTIFPYICTLQFGGTFPSQKKKNEKIVICPDAVNVVTMKIKRIKKS